MASRRLTRDTNPAFSAESEAKRHKPLPLVLQDDPLPAQFQAELEQHCRVLWLTDDFSDRADEIVGVFSYQHRPVQEALLEQLSGVKVISNFGAGYDHIDVAAARNRNVAVGNTPGVVATATADLAFGLMLAARRNIVSGHSRVKNCIQFDPNWFGTQVTGCTMGVVGMGAIGQELAKRAKGFDMHTLYHSRTRKSAEIEAELRLVWCDSLEKLLPLCDVVILSMTCSPETHNLIGTPQLALMKKTALLVNVARGKVVDTEALVEALQQGRIAMAALDVTEPEPLPQGHPLLELENVVLTPHLGTATEESRLRMLRMAIANLEAGLDGKELPNPV